MMTKIDMAVQVRLDRIVLALRSEITNLQALNGEAAKRRQFKRGPFDFTADTERGHRIAALQSVIAAFES